MTDFKKNWNRIKQEICRKFTLLCAIPLPIWIRLLLSYITDFFHANTTIIYYSYKNFTFNFLSQATVNSAIKATSDTTIPSVVVYVVGCTSGVLHISPITITEGYIKQVYYKLKIKHWYFDYHRFFFLANTKQTKWLKWKSLNTFRIRGSFRLLNKLASHLIIRSKIKMGLLHACRWPQNVKQSEMNHRKSNIHTSK